MAQESAELSESGACVGIFPPDLLWVVQIFADDLCPRNELIGVVGDHLPDATLFAESARFAPKYRASFRPAFSPCPW